MGNRTYCGQARQRKRATQGVPPPKDKPIVLVFGYYDSITDVAGRVRRGSLAIGRLDPEAEQGRIAGGQRNVEASVIPEADATANQEASATGRSRVGSHSDTVRRQERLLENYAKRESIWFDYNKFFRTATVIGSGEMRLPEEFSANFQRLIARHITRAEQEDDHR